MALRRKHLIVGAITMIALSPAAVVGIRELTDDPGSPGGPSACSAWSEGAREAARARATQLQTHGAHVAVFLDLDASVEERTDAEAFIKARSQVKTAIYESKEAAHLAFAELFADAQEIVRATPVEALPESFRVVLHSPDQESFEAVKAAVTNRPGVDKIRDDRQGAGANVGGPLAQIEAQGYYLDALGTRVDRPAGCS